MTANTVDIRCACGNHARYLVLAEGAGLVCSLCAMRSPHATLRLVDDPELAKHLVRFQRRLAQEVERLAAVMLTHHSARRARGLS